MGLATYRKRRRFDVTPEPPGKRARKAKALSYVIQKHAASTLHYDFRLELDGVLKSWAVPKGPSTNPKDKRLAIEVEDHPVTYGSFEGRIPKGQYGAGTVEIWDRGTWGPEGDPHQALRQGSLHFVLHGQRLTGRWSLVRMDGERAADAKSPQWLLMKSREQAVRTALPSSAAAHRPVAARATGGAVLRERGVQRLQGKSPPRFVEPQLATWVESVPEGTDWLHEIKFDGYRVQARIDRGKVALHTRTGRDWTARFSEVAEALGKLELSNALIDGEVAVMAEDGVTSFQLLQNTLGDGEQHPLTYYMFDLLYLNGRDLSGEPLEQRKHALHGLLPAKLPKTAIIRYSDHVEGQGEAFHLAACHKGLEGIISKRRSGPYRAGRSREWVKSKCRPRQEFVIGGYTLPRGGRKSFGALLLGARDAGGKLVYAGRVGTGFNATLLRSLLAQLHPLERTRSPFADAPVEHGIHWVEPKLVAEVSFANWTQEHLLRQAAFEGLREDKRARDVVMETPQTGEQVGEHAKAKPLSPPRPSVRGSKSRDGDSVAGVTLTHPMRIVYTPEGFTKWKLASYIERATRWMLPHVIERPLMILRCPGGVGTWAARLVDLKHPDRLVFDLDPHESVKWPRIIAVAREFKRRLEEYDLPVFVKTSGGKGLHVSGPLRRVHTWAELRAAAERIAGAIVAEHPGDLTLQISKTKRTGKILIDTLRNLRGATCVAPYSPRARAGATISLPLAWAQLTPRARPETFTIATWPRRAKRRVDPWREWEASRARLPAALLHPLSAPPLRGFLKVLRAIEASGSRRWRCGHSRVRAFPSAFLNRGIDIQRSVRDMNLWH